MAINIDEDTTTNAKENHSDLPRSTSLQFPPFPRVPHGRFLLPYNQFVHQGLAVSSSSGPFQPRVIDITRTVELVEPVPDGQNTAGRQQKSPINDNAPSLPISERNAWLIGKEGGGWEEPEGSSTFDGDL
jgi:hypothetical protein